MVEQQTHKLRVTGSSPVAAIVVSLLTEGLERESCEANVVSEVSRLICPLGHLRNRECDLAELSPGNSLYFTGKIKATGATPTP